MKLRYFSFVLFFILFVNHSHQQGFNFNPLSNLSNAGSNLLNGYRNGESTDNSQSGGIVGTIRNRISNTTSVLLTRLEQPRDRVIALIRPAVKSDLSRNVTNVLNSIWNRIQSSNISIIQNPVVRTSIVRPINISLERLKQITAEDVEHAEVNGSNLEIINLNNPGEEQHFREYIISSSSNNEERSAPLLLLVTDNETLANKEVENSLNANSKDEINLNDDKQSNNQADDQAAEQSTEQSLRLEFDDESKNKQDDENRNEQANQNEQTDSKDDDAKSDQVVEQPKEDEPNEPVKSLRAVDKRRARFMDQYTYVTPDRVRNFYDRVQRNRMRECLGLAICESNCRPHLYGGGRGSFGGLFDRVQSFNLDHNDANYYLEARRYGQQFYGPQYLDECYYCHRRYRCEHNREQLMNSFAKMGEFY